MQITLNQTEVSEIVRNYVQESFGLDDSNKFAIELNEDGITILVNEEPSEGGEQQSTTTERPAKKPRRTKAQMEADNKAEAARLAEAQAAGASSGNEQVTQTTSVEVATTTEDASNSDAGGQPDEQVNPQSDEPAVAVTEVANATDPEPETEVEPETPPVRQSLFANLRKPNNG